MKSLIASIAILGLVGMVVGIAVHGADTASVAATVTVQNISVSVSDGTVTYGTLAAGASTSTLASGLNDLQTATNNGNVNENFNIRGQNTGCPWTLASSVGANTYKHEFSKDNGSTWTAALTTSNQSLATSVATSTSQTFDLQITTPTSSTCYGQQSVDVT